MIIAIDAMGGENSPTKNIEGISIFLNKNKNKADFTIQKFKDQKNLEFLYEKI